ncbi:EpsG family protein [Pseudoalteromonas sp. C2R02]|uniref:EpsG family protein n=1 Tax=Pseudoalteromonas sp. C2R02 TaxID=2841565 RepID=UPI001C09DFB5|nr:EpsG family protein [Pseudoalteromonas sp. C2R02]MBU2972620.1 EpsG family protein [Pseudoalteromonas sp. C2R02]
MHYYVLAGALFGFYCLLMEVFKVERKVLALSPALLCFAFFIGMRDFSIGTDTLTYVEIYKYIPTITEFLGDFSPGFHGERIEWGFFLLLSTLKELSVTPHLVLVFISFLSLMFFAASFKHLSPNYFLGMFILTVTNLFLTFEYNIIRQGLATSVVMFALTRLVEKRYLAYFLLTMLAMSFHVIAILSLLVFPFRNFKWQPKYLLFVFFAFVGLSFLDVLAAVVFQLRHISIAFWRVFLYLQSSVEELKIMSWMLLSSVLLIFTCIAFVRQIRVNFKYIDFILTFVTIGMFGVLFTHELSVLSIRLGFLFFAIEPVLILALLTLIKDEWPKFVILFLLTSLVLMKNIFITAQYLSPYTYF